jgi:Na+/H+-dicarboxylate symporter
MTSEPRSPRRRTPLHYQILIAMVIGTVIGLLINPGKIKVGDDITLTVHRVDASFVLTESTEFNSNTEELVREVFESRESFERSFPELSKQLGDDQSMVIKVDSGTVRLQYEFGAVNVIWQRSHSGVPAVTQISADTMNELPAFWKRLAGQHPAGIGSTITSVVRFIGDMFLRLLKMVTVPLILTSLITGVTGLGQHGRFGRMFSRTLMYYVATSLLAICTGLVLVNLVSPGVGATLPGGGRAVAAPDGSLAEVLMTQLLRLVPVNPFQAIANGEFLSIISFAIFFGLFINLVGGEHARRLAGFFEAAFQVMMKMTSAIISLAPVGVAAFMVYATATQGYEIFGTLAKYMLTVFLALAVHACITLPLIVRYIGKRNPWHFMRSMSPSLLTAFSTASSNAALPLTMTCVEERAGISNRTSSFVLPLGATINMDGTALYEAVAVLFIAQATPGFELSLVQQITVAITALLASVGAAGIPHAGLVMMAIVLQAVGLPLEAQGVIIAVDRVLDMLRTAVNVWSDSCGCAVVNHLVNDDAKRGEPVHAQKPS